MDTSQLIREALHHPTSAIAYCVSQKLAALYPDRGMVESNDCSFNLEAYSHAQHCTIAPKPIPHSQVLTHWAGSNDYCESIQNAWLEVAWQQHKLEVLLVSWQGSYSAERCCWIVADTQAIAQDFLTTVCEWNSEVRDEVLVFEDGYWAKDPALFQAIQTATFDNLILAGTLKQDIQTDLESFFNARSIYKDYGVPWKRGILLIGQPGNGKTHTVKALINKLQKPCLYVKNFRGHGGVGECMRLVFQKARQSAPCVLVLEDLDALVNSSNRSFFLNELDGFALNEGIVALATTNHPERLDPAITDRPSRFDRKYHFELPALSERLRYIQMWNAKLKPAMQLADLEAEAIAQQTADFSFAYLKELFLSSMMAWIEQRAEGEMAAVMRSQVVKLKEQMSHSASTPEEEVEIAEPALLQVNLNGIDVWPRSH